MAKVFEYYLRFPEEVRKVVINEMEPNDRCRFTRCSKLSQNEAMKCKKYIYGMKLYGYSEYSINFSVIYDEKHKNTEYGDYNIHFLEGYGGKKYIVYSNRYGAEMWRSELDRSINIMNYACENAKSMLNIHLRTIKKLWMRRTGNYDFEIRSLSNLESLTLGDNTDIRQIMSKIQKPLKEFMCIQPISEIFTREFQQIYEVQNRLDAERIHLDYAQFRQLSAANINIDIGILTEKNISDFIISWRNDKLRENFRSCQWYASDSNFDVQKLFRLLRIDHNVDERQQWTKVDIKHNTDAGKKAEFSYSQTWIKFRILNQ